MTTTACAHPNIALVKYWGKQDAPGNLPVAPSLSVTLSGLTTTTTVGPADADSLLLNGDPSEDAKIQACLTRLRRHYAIPPLRIETRNDFPTAAGLASSASGFAALITAIDAECALGMSAEERADQARQASGSAARSCYGGFVGLTGPHWTGEPLLAPADWPLEVVIAITTEAAKAVPSSEGMRASAASAYFPAWVSSTAADYEDARSAVAARDFPVLARITEASCLKMHGLMLATPPGLIYWNAGTLSGRGGNRRRATLSSWPIFRTSRNVSGIARSGNACAGRRPDNSDQPPPALVSPAAANPRATARRFSRVVRLRFGVSVIAPPGCSRPRCLRARVSA